MKIVFLDIDGVLNDKSSKSHAPSGCRGLDSQKVKRLKQIVDATNAIIVLSSSWKDEWEKVLKNEQSEDANYMDKKLKAQKLFIFDKIKGEWKNRGLEIYNWMQGRNVESFVVLDDEIFDDYETYGILPFLVHTDPYNGGLTDDDVLIAIKILNNL